MSDVPRRGVLRSGGVLVLGVVGLALLGTVALLAPGGPQGTARTVLAVVAVLAIPSWLVGRLVDDEGDAIVRVAAGVVATVAVCVLGGFLGYELGFRVMTAVAVIPLALVVAVATLLGVSGPTAPRARLAPLGLAGCLGIVSLLAAWGTHLVLPATPIEPAFSIEAATASVSPHGLVVAVTVSRVHTTSPEVLVVTVDRHLVTTAVVTAQTQLRLTASLPPHTTTCPSVVRVTAANGAFLTPPVTCTGL